MMCFMVMLATLRAQAARFELSKPLLLAFVACWLGGLFDGMDASLMHLVLPLAVTELTGQTLKQASNVAATISAVFLVGWMLGGILFGVLGDKLGRVKAMILSILLYSLFTGLSGLAHSWPELAAYRFLTGVGIGGELVTIATFLTEVWPKATRAYAVGALLTSYQVGVFLAGALHYVLPDWRVTFFVGAIPALLVMALRSLVSESEEWIEAKQAEAYQAAQADASQATHVSGWQQLLVPPYRREVVVGAVAFGALLIGYWASLAWIPSWMATLPNLPEWGRSAGAMWQGSAAVVGCLSAGWLCNRLGRRWGIALPALAGVLAACWLFLGHQQFSHSVLWANAAMGLAIGGMQAGLYIYLPERFPTLLRATGTGICLNAGRLVTALAVLAMGWVVAALGGYGQAALAFSGAYAVLALAMLFGRDANEVVNREPGRITQRLA
jgi:MFS family permease